jgi:single-stranded-DNA-specific exonuclease
VNRGDERLDAWLTTAAEAHATTKRLHRRCLSEAQEQVSRLHFRDHSVMVVAGSDWHQGLMGPLAAQLAERYGRPAIAVAMGARHGTGSGRSTPLFNLLEALRRCQGELVRFGGHAQACGLTLERGRLESFRARINQQARLALGREGLLTRRTADVELPLSALQPQWVQQLQHLAPFGHGNPRPTVILRRLTIETVSPRIARLSDGRVSVRGKGAFVSLVEEGRYDVLGTPAWVGGELVLTVSDVRVAAALS